MISLWTIAILPNHSINHSRSVSHFRIFQRLDPTIYIILKWSEMEVNELSECKLSIYSHLYSLVSSKLPFIVLFVIRIAQLSFLIIRDYKCNILNVDNIQFVNLFVLAISRLFVTLWPLGILKGDCGNWIIPWHKEPLIYKALQSLRLFTYFAPEIYLYPSIWHCHFISFRTLAKVSHQISLCCWSK